MSQARPPALTRRRFLRFLLGGGLGVAALGGLGAAQAYRFGVTGHTRTLRGLKTPVRIAFLTDLHYGLYMHRGSAQAWVAAVNAQQPDLILLGGDQIDTRADAPIQELTGELRHLRAPLGMYGVWGNHDYGSFGQYGGQHYGPPRQDWQARREEARLAFQNAGITILRNEGHAVRDDLYVGGVDDLWQGKPDPTQALAGAGNRATLLVSHNPDLLPDLPAPIGLVLCGHTHGGQVRLPLLGAPVVPSQYGQRYAMGWVAGAHDTPAYVSRGLGLSGLPLRNMCEPEITLLTLNPASA